MSGSNELPAPPVPAEADLRDFPFMPLDVARLRDSELVADETPEACFAAVLLWAASWHQLPAGSIPDNEQWIAKACNYVFKGKVDRSFAKVRAGALRGWVKAADGRLYHSVVTEKVIEAWAAKLRQRWGSECARIRKHNERHQMALPKPTFEEWKAGGCLVGQPLPVTRDNQPVSTGQTSDRGADKDGTAPPPPPANSLPTDPEELIALVSVMDRKEGAPLTEEEQTLLWRAGRAMFNQANIAADAAGRFIGKLIKDNGNDRVLVFDVLRTAILERSIDPRGYMKATCQHKRGERQRPNKQEALEQSNAATGDAWAAGGAANDPHMQPQGHAA